jgi:hypothetical protein
MICHRCSKPIEESEPPMPEVAPSYLGGKVTWFHIHCHTEWRDEQEAKLARMSGETLCAPA